MGRLKDEKEKPVKTGKKIYAICEGLTEKQYLEYFQSYNRTAGYFDITIFEKKTFEVCQSERMQMVDLLDGIIALKTTGKYTPYMFVTIYLHNCLDCELNKIEYEYGKKKIYENLNYVRKSVLNDIKSFIDENGYVKDFEEIENLIRIKATNQPALEEYTECFNRDPSDLRNPECFTITDADRYFVIFDRDKEINNPSLRSNSEYKKIIDRCKDSGYDVLLSTPMFEFWLLLHHHDVPRGSYPPDLSQKMTILEELAEEETECNDWKHGSLDKVKSISEKRFESYYCTKSFKNAVSRSKKLDTNPYHLLDNIGSNVGIELESLLKP